MEQNLLEMLLSEMSVSGEEFALQDKLAAHMESVSDSMDKDSIGNGVYFVKGMGRKRILLAAHIDEIGLMITGVTAQGYLRVINVAGIHARTYPGHGVRIQTEQGIIYGSVILEAKALKQEEFTAKNLLIDIGADSKEEALKLIRIGDTAVPDAGLRKLAGGRLMARGLDDKSGVYVIMEALKRLKRQETPNTVLAAATVGEEIGQHGASWTAARTCPDEAIIVDVTYTSDYPGVEHAEWGEIELGKGPAIGVNPICDKQITRALMEIAEKEGIPYQTEVNGGRSCTDADEIHISGTGIPVALVSVPLRYMHSPAEVADEKDLENAVRLLAAYLSR